MNILAYIIYLFITYLVTVRVGLLFFRNGRVYILGLLQGDVSLTDFINKILLVGYYLMNLGYAAVMISCWSEVHTWLEMLTSITTMTGRILLTLSVMHYINMALILLIKYQHFKTL